jgi:nitrite reductase/ring-hydroxylating ferredoxin subunit
MTITKANDAFSEVPAGWYAVARTWQVGRRPVSLAAGGDPVIAWRSAGKLAVTARYCPHFGADLAAARVSADGHLRCRFHGWQFDGTGACVAIPRHESIPKRARLSTRAFQERYGYIWIWHGTTDPLFPLPNVPELESASNGALGTSWRLRLNMRARTSTLHVLENLVDGEHLDELHRIGMADRTVRVLDRPAFEKSDPRYPQPHEHGAWFGVSVESPVASYEGLAAGLARWLGFEIGGLKVLNDCFPGGVVTRAEVDGEPMFCLIGSATPESPRSTRLRAVMAIAKAPSRHASVARYLGLAVQSWLNARQDNRIWSAQRAELGGVYLKRDAPLMQYRKFHARWVDACATDRTPAPRDT